MTNVLSNHVRVILWVAGIQCPNLLFIFWISAFAGMTDFYCYFKQSFRQYWPVAHVNSAQAATKIIASQHDWPSHTMRPNTQIFYLQEPE